MPADGLASRRSTLPENEAIPMCIRLHALALLALPFVFAPSDGAAEEPSSRWHTDYRTAVSAAKDGSRMLLIYFHKSGKGNLRDAFKAQVLEHPSIVESLRKFEVVKLPTDYEIRTGGKQIQLMNHSSFSEMHHNVGVAIVDYQDPDDRLYGRVVSQFPFTIRRRLDRKQLAVILDLPRGTLTQRTLIFAVRTHPECPASSNGVLDPVLTEEATRHAEYQARTQVQGHQNWDARFQRISGKMPGGLIAKEVCAESWPGDTLVDAAVECVDSWRHSAGHWGAVRALHDRFGYDLKKGANGVWYGTGIFASQ